MYAKRNRVAFSVDIVMHKEVIIIGAGPAGIGVGIVLKRMGIPFIILEREDVGSSFTKWPKEMRFISPSFTSNFFGMPDLNAISPETSPAYTLQTEHPTGSQYAGYLTSVANHYDLPIKTECDVASLEKQGDTFRIKTSQGIYKSDNVIWAAGEYQYPNDKPFDGAEECIHNSQVNSWKSLKGDYFVVIGAYESGIDAAYQLSALGKKVTVLDAGDELGNEESDSSYSLSPFTRDRFAENESNIEVIANARVVSVRKKNSVYTLHLANGENIVCDTQPILATGFVSSLSLVSSLFDETGGYIQLTDDDESTKTSGLFLVGPQVRHGGAIFCFIYKYRQRFAIVAETIANRLGKESEAEEVVNEYKMMNFYLKDLSCCDDECVC